MTEEIDYEIRRRAAASVTRRHSFLMMGGAASAAAVPVIGEASEAGKKARKRCKRQRGECRASVEEFCGSSASCLADLLPCCDPLATCNARASTACLLNFQVN
jgi:hypothetical protein